MNEFSNESFFKQNVVWIAALAGLIIFSILLLSGWGRALNNSIDQMMTIRGQFSCLPLKGGAEDTTGCELGLRSNGDHYALDITCLQDADRDLMAEDTIAVTGFVRPASSVATSTWAKYEKYEVKNVIFVNTLLRTR